MGPCSLTDWPDFATDVLSVSLGFPCLLWCFSVFQGRIVDGFEGLPSQKDLERFVLRAVGAGDKDGESLGGDDAGFGAAALRERSGRVGLLAGSAGLGFAKKEALLAQVKRVGSCGD